MFRHNFIYLLFAHFRVIFNDQDSATPDMLVGGCPVALLCGSGKKAQRSVLVALNSSASTL